MRGQVQRQQAMFVAFNIEQRVPEDHPLRAIKRWCDTILAGMSRDFNSAYGDTGNVGIPPESLIKAQLLRALYSIPSERRLCEACEFNILYRWFIDWPLEEPMWTPETFSMNLGRFEAHDLVGTFFNRVVAEGIIEGLIGDDRFVVDGTLIRSMAGHAAAQTTDTSHADQATTSTIKKKKPGRPARVFMHTVFSSIQIPLRTHLPKLPKQQRQVTRRHHPIPIEVTPHARLHRLTKLPKKHRQITRRDNPISIDITKAPG